MSIGKNPHRPEGKADTDNEHMQAAWKNAGPPHNASRNDKARAQKDHRELRDRQGGPLAEQSGQEEVEVGGSRPGVPSRVQDAIARREAREEEEEQRDQQ